MNAALHFEPDAYILGGAQIMGRRMAGAAFLRAAVEGRQGDVLAGVAKSEEAGEKFVAAVRSLDPAAHAVWLPSHRFDLLRRLRMLYRPDVRIGANARLRLRAGPAAYGICGVTHTLSTDNA